MLSQIILRINESTRATNWCPYSLDLIDAIADELSLLSTPVECTYQSAAGNAQSPE